MYAASPIAPLSLGALAGVIKTKQTQPLGTSAQAEFLRSGFVQPGLTLTSCPDAHEAADELYQNTAGTDGVASEGQAPSKANRRRQKQRGRRKNGIAVVGQGDEPDEFCDPPLSPTNTCPHQSQEWVTSPASLPLAPAPGGPLRSNLAATPAHVPILTASSAQSSCPVLPRTLANSPAAPGSGAASSSSAVAGSSAMPELSLRAAQAIGVVRKASEENRRLAWQSLRQEFEVQQLIWNNTLFMDSSGRWNSSSSAGDSKRPYADLQSSLVRTLAVAETDFTAASCLLMEVVTKEADADGQGQLNNAMQAAAKRVAEADRLTSIRTGLINLLDAVTRMPSDALQNYQQQLETLVDASALGGLEVSVRLALRLPEKAEVVAQPKAATKTPKRRAVRPLSTNHVPIDPSSCSSSSAASGTRGTRRRKPRSSSTCTSTSTKSNLSSHLATPLRASSVGNGRRF